VSADKYMAGYQSALEAILRDCVFDIVSSFTDDAPDTAYQRGFEQAARDAEGFLLERIVLVTRISSSGAAE
jgi:hypothetical protein